MPTRKNQAIKHFQSRMKQRYNINIPKRRIKVISRQVNSGDALFVKKVDRNNDIFDVIYEGEKVRISYCGKLRVPATALKTHWLGATDISDYITKEQMEKDIVAEHRKC